MFVFNLNFRCAVIHNLAAKALLLMCSVLILMHAGGTEAEQSKSRRIEVYALSQNYWDTKPGDTLDEIATRLLPNNPSKRESLKRDILRLNPKSFIDDDPARLLANKRLWMPGYMKQADSKVDPSTTIVERYSWGNIKRPRN